MNELTEERIEGFRKILEVLDEHSMDLIGYFYNEQISIGLHCDDSAYGLYQSYERLEQDKDKAVQVNLRESIRSFLSEHKRSN